MANFEVAGIVSYLTLKMIILMFGRNIKVFILKYESRSHQYLYFDNK